MSTPYSKVYEYFMSKITDYRFASYTAEELEQTLDGYLKIAISKFKSAKTKLSGRDEETKEFDNDLNDEECNILATLMICDWLLPQINTIELIKQSLSSKDFQLTSQANHLKELRELLSANKKEANQLMNSYSFSKGLEDLD